jgi:hypothetical protein
MPRGAHVHDVWGRRGGASFGSAPVVFRAPILKRPEFPLLREILAREPPSPRHVVDAKRYLADLSVLSSVLTRTRRAEVDEQKAVREAQDIQVPWTREEEAFYEEYVA